MIRAYCRDPQGNAAVEFALVAGIFALALPSVVDVGIYAYQSMQVRNSAQMGVQAIWAACNQLPATDAACATTTRNAVTAAVQRTSLGSAVSWSSVIEAYYCTNATGALANAAANGNTGILTSSSTTGLSTAVVTTPSDCTAVANAQTTTPGDYVSVTVSYTYTPVFRQVSVASLLGTTIQSTATMRLL
jgi:Flp pilus assembly protein TadG